jgi:NAD(P)-dependent dehydrogenase (short-subunit alcohol dehydrogenase family)
VTWNNKTVVVTGGGNGIGKGLCKRFAQEGANVVVSDIDRDAAEKVAKLIGGTSIACNVREESQVQSLVQETEEIYGGIDLFCSNAGIGFGNRGPLATSADNELWQISWEIHVMSHVYAARAVLPSMIKRGGGQFLQTASAAALLSQVGDAAYSSTKHAALGFAESLAISHGDQNIRVSVLCPQYIATNMIGSEFDQENDSAEALPEGVLSPAFVAECVLQSLNAGDFLVLPHPEVLKYFQNKAGDYNRWIGGMRKINRSVVGDTGEIDFSQANETASKR